LVSFLKMCVITKVKLLQISSVDIQYFSSIRINQIISIIQRVEGSVKQEDFNKHNRITLLFMIECIGSST
jgi:hypothetical protein